MVFVKSGSRDYALKRLRESSARFAGKSPPNAPRWLRPLRCTARRTLSCQRQSPAAFSTTLQVGAGLEKFRPSCIRLRNISAEVSENVTSNCFSAGRGLGGEVKVCRGNMANRIAGYFFNSPSPLCQQKSPPPSSGYFYCAWFLVGFSPAPFPVAAPSLLD